ncbi:hypothetical protein M0804_000404 [Polistes exclamans]|nr:hypothetical protein M0804_000404 [Polistes exclamans]
MGSWARGRALFRVVKEEEEEEETSAGGGGATIIFSSFSFRDVPPETSIIVINEVKMEAVWRTPRQSVATLRAHVHQVKTHIYRLASSDIHSNAIVLRDAPRIQRGICLAINERNWSKTGSTSPLIP